MRDSGVKWIGEIPDGWLTRPLRFVAACNPSTSPYGGESQYVALENVEPWTGRLVDMDTDATVDSTVSSFDDGQVLFGKLRPYLGKVIRPSFAGVCTTELLPITPCDMNRDFLYWCLANSEFIKTVNAGTYGVKMPRTSWTQMGRISVPVPPAEEQAGIAKTLDDATDELDSAISTLTDQLDVLRHYRSSLVHEAVTKGLDPSAPMRPSGVEWIGDINAAWPMSKVKYQADVTLGKMLDSGKVEVASIEKPYLRAGNIVNGRIEGDTKEMPFSFEDMSKFLLRGGDALVVEGGNVGETAIYEGTESEMYFQKSLNRVRMFNGRNRFFAYWMSFLKSTGYLPQMCNRSTILHYTREKLLVTPMVRPSDTEQDEIVSYLDERCGHVNRVIDLKERQLDVLRRRRQSLIYEYVTGKRRVR